MANRGCNRCGNPIAWRNVYRRPGDPRSPWEPMEPLKDENGEFVYVEQKNGKDRNGNSRTVRRMKASDTPHRCGNPAPTERPTAPGTTPTPETNPEPHPEPHQMPTQSTQPAQSIDPETLRAIVRGELVEAIKALGIEPPPVRIEVNVNGTPRQSPKGEILHPAVHSLVRYLMAEDGLPRTHVYLYGPAGSGKTFGAGQAASLVGLRSGVVTMPGMTAGKLMGIEQPHGKRTATLFSDFFKNGGVLVLDEFDRCLAPVAAMLNSCLENRVLVEGDERFEAHPDFVVVATGNTDCRGATRTYTSAQPIDLSTVARFRFIHWQYDEGHETAMVKREQPNAYRPILQWARGVRRMLTADRIDTVFCGPRESLGIARDLRRGVTFADAAFANVWRGLDPLTMDRYIAANPYPEIPAEPK